MTYLIIGSQALNYHLGLPHNPDSDIDIIGDSDSCMEFIDRRFRKDYTCVPVEDGKKYLAVSNSREIIEAEVAWPGSTAESLLQLYPDNRYAPTNALLALKLSHRFKKNSVHFEKTRQDIITLLRLTNQDTDLSKYNNLGFQTVLSRLSSWYKQRELDTYQYTHPNLNQSKDKFFNSEETFYKVDHDWLHQVVAYGTVPAYTLYMKDGAAVACDQNKFNALPTRQKLMGVLEEALVLALERSYIPHGAVMGNFQMFITALQKVCTSITSGWFREFAYNNYREVIDLYHVLELTSKNFIYRFEEAFATNPVMFNESKSQIKSESK